MNNFNFGEVLTRAWKIIWKHKVLWIFGVLASCARGNGGGSGGGGDSGYQTGSGGNTPFPTDQFERGAEQFAQFLDENLWFIVAVGVGIILFSFIVYALGMMGRIGLIKGTYKAENGAENLSFGEIWSESLPYFWRIFGLNFLIGFAFLVVLVPLVFFGFITAGLGFLCVLPLLCILIPVFLVVNVVIEQTQAAIVLEDQGMLDGFNRGWQIVKSNAGVMILMAIIIIFGGGVIGVILSLPLIIAVVPVVIGAAASPESLTPLYIALACCAVYLPVLILFNGILTAYIQSAWTLTYLRLTKPKEDAPVFIEANA